MAGHGDNHALRAFHLGFIGRLIIISGIRTDVIDESLFIVIVLRQPCLHLSLEGAQVHGIGIKDILVNLFRPVPAFGDPDGIGIGFGVLFVLL